jgi:2-oxoglutarate dehydrogenase E2 component (dihydrolipoamide succinyltransferase)
LRLAKEHQIGLEELQNIPSSGSAGRLTRKDLEEYIQKKRSSSMALKEVKETSAPSSFPIERVKMTGMRKAIADNMVRSFYQAPHATLIHEVDVTALLHLIQSEKEAFFSKWGVKLTISSFIARAIAKTIQQYPLINSSLEEDTIVLKHFVNLGLAVSVDSGILVPVIKQCHRLTLPQIAKTIAQLAEKARSNQLLPEDVAEGTISMTNFGMSGVLLGIPIIRYPEVAIIGIGSIHKKVMALPDQAIGVRDAVHISLTFDHRVLDGMYGCGFLGSLKERLESDLSL